jgi:hypothetical protein
VVSLLTPTVNAGRASRAEVTEKYRVTAESGILPSGGVNLSRWQAGPYEAKHHDLHRLHVRRNFITVPTTMPAEELLGSLSLYAVGLDRKQLCALNHFDNRFSMASHQPLAWTDLRAGCFVLVLWS